MIYGVFGATTLADIHRSDCLGLVETVKTKRSCRPLFRWYIVGLFSTGGVVTANPQPLRYSSSLSIQRSQVSRSEATVERSAHSGEESGKPEDDGVVTEPAAVVLVIQDPASGFRSTSEGESYIVGKCAFTV